VNQSVEALIEQIESEIRDLDLQILQLQTRRDEKTNYLKQLRIHKAAQPVPPTSRVAMGGRRSMTALGSPKYRVGKLSFPNPGQVLDHFGEPHYFSKRRPREKDEATREIIRWAERNPSLARTVLVIYSNGAQEDLVTAVARIRP